VSILNEADFTTDAPILLALDTSSKVTSIALARGREIIGSFSVRADDNRSERLWLDMQALLDEAGLTIKHVGLFGVCTGPGGFTGLRVGLAAVKGLAAATGKPAVGVTSLAATAYEARGEAPVCALLNAYKGEVYSQLFSFAEGEPVALNAPLVSSAVEAAQRVAHLNNVVFIGDGAIENADVVQEVGGARLREGGATKHDSDWRIQSASEPLAEKIAHLAARQSARGEVETAAGLRACYVRPAEAEIKLRLGLLGSKIKRSRSAE
jgi:tRNA threonylcarbamoyladenosine biosynthesis protein TsaB